MALDTVADYIEESRRLLQDTVAPFRYSDAELIESLNIAILEARRLRPDLFLGRFDNLPDYTATGTTVVMDPQYRSSFVYYMIGRASLRDAEAAQDSRATVFLNKFVSQMLTVQS